MDAERLREQLIAEWPDLYVEVDGSTVLRLYGARALFLEPLKRAEDLSAKDSDLPVEVVLVDHVYCSKSLPVKPGRGVGEPSGMAPRPIEEDARRVWLMCNNEDGHSAHDWGAYQPLPKSTSNPADFMPKVTDRGRPHMSSG